MTGVARAEKIHVSIAIRVPGTHRPGMVEDGSADPPRPVRPGPVFVLHHQMSLCPKEAPATSWSPSPSTSTGKAFPG